MGLRHNPQRRVLRMSNLRRDDFISPDFGR